MPGNEATLVDWSETLDNLVRRADTAVQSRDVDGMRQAQSALRQFVDDSPVFADPLDRIARRVVGALDLAATEVGVSSLESYREEIAGVVKALEGHAASLHKSAATLRLERATAAVKAITSTVEALNDVRSGLKTTGNDKAVADAILKAIGEIQRVRSLIETA